MADVLIKQIGELITGQKGNAHFRNTDKLGTDPLPLFIAGL
jgi:hypothetical protein